MSASAKRVGLLYDERMCRHTTPDGEPHPEDPERLRAIWRKLQAEGIPDKCVVFKAKEAEEKHIASVHSQNHIKQMRNVSAMESNRRNRLAWKYNSIYFNEGSSESAFLAAGSVIEVTDKVAKGELNSAIALVRPPGHHAEHDEAMGFCLFNNVAIAASSLLNERPELGIKKILIVDWDVHHGNGTQNMFYSDPRVLFFSVHRFDFGYFYPAGGARSHCFIGEGGGQGYNINVPWEHGFCGDADYFAVWDYILLPVAKAFDPDIILVSAGFDAALDDPLGGCCITPYGYSCLLSKLTGFAQGKIIMALEGGYNLKSIANSVLACAKVLLGEKPVFKSLEAQPFEATWRVIQEVRDELKAYWPVLGSEIPKEVLSQRKSFPLELYFSGVETGVDDDDDVEESLDAAASVNVIESAEDDVSTRIGKLNIDEGDHASTTTPSSSKQDQADSVECLNDAAVLASKSISDLPTSWRSVLSNTYIWYASYGSNMWKPRFLCYMEGGKAEGMNIICCGSQDKSPPREVMWKTVNCRLFFGRSFTPCWGVGGVAFLQSEFDSNEKSYICMYKITLEQFNDLLFQENRFVERDNILGENALGQIMTPLIGLSEIDFVSTSKSLHLDALKGSWYSNVLYLGKEDDLPVLTMTCSSSDLDKFKAGELPLAAPSKSYASTLVKGLVEGEQLSFEEATAYINSAASKNL